MRVKGVILIILLLMSASVLGGADDPAYVERIEFKGVKNIDRYEIIRSAKGKASGKGILIEIKTLKEVLKSNILIKNYDIDMGNGSLTISIEEKYPVFMLLVADKSISTPCLVDENSDIIETGLFFKNDMPIIIVDRAFYGDKRNTPFVKELLANLKQLRQAGSPLADELSEIEVQAGGGLRISLKSRKTVFYATNEPKSFKKIEKSAAYLDAVNVYPASLDLKDKRILIRE